MDTKAAFDREAFEAWFEKEGHEELCGSSNVGAMIKHIAKSSWQASRAAIEIELPEPNAHLIWIQAGHAPDDYWDDVEVSRSEEDKCCDGSDRYEVYAKWQLEEVFTSHGIRIKDK